MAEKTKKSTDKDKDKLKKPKRLVLKEEETSEVSAGAKAYNVMCMYYGGGTVIGAGAFSGNY